MTSEISTAMQQCELEISQLSEIPENPRFLQLTTPNQEPELAVSEQLPGYVQTTTSETKLKAHFQPSFTASDFPPLQRNLTRPAASNMQASSSIELCLPGNLSLPCTRNLGFNAPTMHRHGVDCFAVLKQNSPFGWRSDSSRWICLAPHSRTNHNSTYPTSVQAFGSQSDQMDTSLVTTPNACTGLHDLLIGPIYEQSI
jgi:hypothetical protein